MAASTPRSGDPGIRRQIRAAVVPRAPGSRDERHECHGGMALPLSEQVISAALLCGGAKCTAWQNRSSIMLHL